MEYGKSFSVRIKTGPASVRRAAFLPADRGIPGPQVFRSSVHQLRAALTSDQQQAHDRVAIQARKPFSAANRAAFQQTMQRTLCRLRIGLERVAGQFFVGFRKSVLAGCAFPALDVTLTEGTSLHAIRVLASYACHGLFSACVEREKPYNHFGSGLRLTPRLD